MSSPLEICGPHIQPIIHIYSTCNCVLVAIQTLELVVKMFVSEVWFHQPSVTCPSNTLIRHRLYSADESDAAVCSLLVLHSLK